MDPFPVLGFRFILTEKKVKSKGNRTRAVPLKGFPLGSVGLPAEADSREGIN